MHLLLFGIGMQEVIVIALIVLLLFGGKKIPELMKGLGKGVKSFKDGMKEIEADDKDDDKLIVHVGVESDDFPMRFLFISDAERQLRRNSAFGRGTLW